MTKIYPLHSIKLIVLITITALNLAWGSEVYPPLPLKDREERLAEIQTGIDSRWQKLKTAKENSFALYENKSDEEIIAEFQRLHNLRTHLWYHNTEQMPYINNPDYEFYIPLSTSNQAHKKRPALAFFYNYADHFHNASTILIFGNHFIALREPGRREPIIIESLNAFFRVLINHNVSILVRLKPEGEYKESGSLNYWEDKIVEGPDYPLIEPRITDAQGTHRGAAIPYCYTNNWVDDSGIDLDDLYNLVQRVRKIYKETKSDGPIACHCAAGVGRTGTFIAAYCIAELLDIINPLDSSIERTKRISIEALVLRLSIQRPEMVANEEQYLLLYRFVDYYMSKKNSSEDNDATASDL